MESEVLSAVIAGTLALIGVIVSALVNARTTTKKIENQIFTAQAVTDTKIDELTREVREHNHFAQRIPVVEEKIKVINHRIEDLESFHK